MRNLRAWSIPCLLLVSTCLTASEAFAQAGAQTPARAQRVVLLSLDGFAAVRHRELLRQGAYTDPAGVAAFENGGYVVERALPAEPTLTSVSHAAIASGAFPTLTGIVSNRFHLPGAPIFQGVSGFDAAWGAESLWQAFRRQGRRAGVLGFPGCDGKTASRTADFGMTYVNTPLSRSQIVVVTAGQFTSTTLPAGWTSYSPAKRATVTVSFDGADLPATATFTATALDTTDDGVADYDTLVLDNDADLSNGVLSRAHAGEWFPLRLRLPHPDGGTRTVGAWCLLQAMPGDLSAVKIYRGAFFSTEAYPRAYRESIDEQTGFWPGPGDEHFLAKGMAGEDGLQLADYIAQTRRFSEFFTACATATVARERFDLLMLYQPIVDEVEHKLLLANPRQKNYSPGLAATAQGAVVATFRIADHAVGELARALDLSRDALVVVSDHGMAPVWENIHVNQALQQAGLAAGEQVNGVWRVKGTSEMVAYSSGGCSHLYVNLRGRESTGVVAPEKKDEVIQAAAAFLARLQVDGQNVVEAMYRRDEAAAIGLDSPNAGDLVVFLYPGFAATSLILAPGAPAHEQADYYGQHGFRNTHPEVAAVWLARGAGVPPRHLAEESLTEVAAFVAHLAGVAPPANAQPWQP